MKRTLFIIFCCLMAVNAEAAVHCYDDASGTTRCSGSNEEGKEVHTYSYSDGAGSTKTVGHIGDESVHTHSYSDGTGSTVTSGRVGKDSYRNTSF